MTKSRKAEFSLKNSFKQNKYQSLLLFRASQTLSEQLLSRSWEKNQNTNKSYNDKLDYIDFERKLITTERRLRLSTIQTHILKTAFCCNLKIDINVQTQLVKELKVKKDCISVSLFSRV